MDTALLIKPVNIAALVTIMLATGMKAVLRKC